MTQTEMWAVIIGFVTPLLVAVVNQPQWTRNQKRVLAVGVSVIVGVLNLVAQGAFTEQSLTWSGALASLVLVIGAAQASYALLWKPSGVAETVEAATEYVGRHRE